MRVGDSWRKLASNDLAVLVLFATAGVFLHTVTNGQYGFHRDELATLDDARLLAWGYVAYPPVTPFLARVAFILWMFIVPFVLFVIGRGRPYYMAPGYPMLLAAGAVWGERWVASLSSRRALLLRRTTWRALAIGGLVNAAIVLPIAPPGSLWWRFADSANGGNFNEEIGWPELVQTVASIRDSLPVAERPRLGILAADSGQAGAINLYGPALRLPRAICGMNSHWLRGYGDPSPETVIVVGMSRDSAQSAFESCQIAGQPWPSFWKGFQYYGYSVSRKVKML